jgi:hypothetical protein
MRWLQQPFIIHPGTTASSSPCGLDTATALGRGRTYYSCITLATGLLRRSQQCCVYLVGSPEEELWLWIQLTLVPGRDIPMTTLTLALLSRGGNGSLFGWVLPCHLSLLTRRRGAWDRGQPVQLSAPYQNAYPALFSFIPTQSPVIPLQSYKKTASPPSILRTRPLLQS